MIQSTSNIPGFFRTDAFTNTNGKKSSSLTTDAGKIDSLSSASTQSLRDALANTSEVRSNVVERGKALAVDASYPPRAIIESLAKLMVESRDLTSS